MPDTAIIIIGGYEVIAALEESYIQKHMIWGNQCASMRASFKKKTSRKKKNGTLYEYTNWYRETYALFNAVLLFTSSTSLAFWSWPLAAPLTLRMWDVMEKRVM